MATPTSWAAPSPYPAAQPVGTEELSLQARPMGLKVHYSFDRENQVHCLARWHQILQIQTIPLDEKTTIGVVDLRTCLEAVSQSSPEILNQQDHDYSVYAYDYSEPDVPLVGQGLLSWNMDPQRGSQQQLVTGRVTRNLLALLNNGSRDTLEVKLKFATVAKSTQRTEYPSAEAGKRAKSTSIPAETVSEWNSFIQSNTMLGHASNNGAVSSPALAPAQLSQYNPHVSESRPMDTQGDSQPPQPIRPATMTSAQTLQPVAIQPASRPSSAAAPIPPRPQGSLDSAPSPAASQPTEPALKPRPSRSRSKQPTGRPRGRPRKRPLETGNTSAVEEGTDGDDGPQKRRVKVTQAEYSVIAPFGVAPDSLRVAASTSGSLRAMRPVGAGGETSAPSHLQDVPRVPTPIPDGQMLQQQQRRRALENQAKTEHTSQFDQPGPGRSIAQSGIQDARSPADSNAQSPDHGYMPEDSAGDLNSSPPVPRTTPYIQSSPPASSPILPTMPMPPIDSGFMSGGLEDIFDEDILQRLPQEQMQDPMLPLPSLPDATKAVVPRKKSRSQRQQQEQKQQLSDFPFQEVNPGPPELLPTKSIFNPAGKAKTLNRQASSGPQPAPKPSTHRPFKRSNTAPIPAVSGQDTPHEQVTYQQNGNTLQQEPAQQDSHEEQLSLADGDGMGDSIQPATNDAEKGGSANSPPEPAPAASVSMPVPDRPEPERISPAQPPSRPTSRSASRDAPALKTQGPATSASETAPEPTLTLPRPPASEPPCPPSDFDPPRYSKNLVKKQSIKEKLESAIDKGETPPFCSNCGAIETPTWRKIWTQDHEGVPEFHEFSDKPGCVTMIEVLERDENEQPSRYRMVKKNLGPRDEKRNWVETLLCNPCGIWLGKFKVHRPPDRWDKDAARLNQPRRKREPKGRSKKSRTKSDNAPANPTSEAYLATDPIGPLDHDFLTDRYENAAQSQQQSAPTADEQHLNLRSSPRQRFLGSTHSRGSGTADSPIAVEDQLGSTRRLLFPSPRRDGEPKTLGELPLNTTQTTSTHAPEAKSAPAGKENKANQERPGTPVVAEDELEQELFGTPPRRPSTPPPKATAGPFKTPTRPTPNHRPITRSISRSIRSSRGSILKSPAQLFALQHLEQTPSRTPRSASGFPHPGSASKRRTPRSSSKIKSDDNSNHNADFALDASEHNQLSMGMAMQTPMQFDSPFTATLHQLLSEANEFIGGNNGGGGGGDGSPSRRGTASRGEPGHLDLHDDEAGMDFGSFLGTDLVMPSSPPLVRRARTGGGHGNGEGEGDGSGGDQFGGVLQEGVGDDVWGQK
ncbi:uncharacterized protein P884DRAFT_195807 [Thermothelomyces heterothallicus CBS 202.75]|uniref:uncharacterized protein n=1 Tax=Thermothelomyces heterothallicus CBS 202.75 TaxID=1149848 RepID=UPI00374334AB